MDQLGCQFDVVAHYLLVLGNAINIADTTGQVSIYARTQLTLPELQETESLPTLAQEAATQRLALWRAPVIKL